MVFIINAYSKVEVKRVEGATININLDLCMFVIRDDLRVFYSNVKIKCM